MSIIKLHFNSFLSQLSFHNSPNVAHSMIILNSDTIKLSLLSKLWDKCSTKVCADGGANRLFDANKTAAIHNAFVHQYVPDYITGDLDSIRPDVEDYYR